MTSRLEQLNLGQKIRRLRESRGKTLDQFGKELGMSASLLQQIEKNDISPPIAILLNIAHNCNKELGYFFDITDEERPYTLVRSGRATQARRIFPQGKNPLSYNYKTLAPHKTARKMEPFLVEFSANREEIPQVAHDGEEFFYVLSGKLECRLGDQRIKIARGDSLYFESKYPHAFRVLGNRKATAIVVLYPH